MPLIDHHQTTSHRHQSAKIYPISCKAIMIYAPEVLNKSRCLYTATAVGRRRRRRREQFSHRRRQTNAAASSSSERPATPSARAALREPADFGRGAAPGFARLPSFCRGVTLVGAGAGMGLPSGASATLAFL